MGMDQILIPHTVRTVDADHLFAFFFKRLVGSDVNGHLDVADLQRHQRVIGGIVRRNITVQHGHAEDIELIARSRKYKRGSVVGACIRIYYHLVLLRCIILCAAEKIIWINSSAAAQQQHSRRS